MSTQENAPMIERRWRWLLVVDGILVLLLCVVLLAWFVPEMIRRYSPRPRVHRGPIVGEAKTEAAAKGFAIQDIRLLPPRKMPRSGVWAVEVEQRDLEQEKRLKRVVVPMSDVPAYGPYYKPPEFQGISGRSTVNLLLFSEDEPGGYLLFDRQVLIQGVVVPSHPDDPQDYILYDVVLEDANSDGRLTREDDKSLWLSDLYGKKLIQVTPDSLALDSFSFSEDKRQIYIVAWLRSTDRAVPREHWEQAIYVFNVDRRKLAQVPINPTITQKARSLLQQ